MKFFTTLITALMLALSLPAWADVSRDDAASMAQKTTGGRVLAVDQAQREGRPVWRVKLLTPQGEVVVVLIDVASGRRL
ncbi:PepSY domain-containing protein [Rhodoferax sp.]|uniref:PepSY domain-containing protein n=1 Tax=Rhodoferax sp. TaxID=50421 RepID=UPI0008B38101|nr:PepSY domain-containing protein [Rhodoferax sp.]OGB42831.1 MAG: peptidase [Burkholderiales bacterium RIFOXYC2_FULL_59_8]OGB53660.1 MAG: peptidase [Burkholderiales bacterium RIFOXYD12_FULL_59_19]OGB75652.1 MAG: peptidase [Burkholderiales bacterium RIFOXYC12_FULL_60_6]MDO8318814.1 PepSY domain-containing protein [Rhodoferax sp.]MDP2680406.1 PepSY domain-containing protein [Rhodoferax sp.]